jgi:hypothetical protein
MNRFAIGLCLAAALARPLSAADLPPSMTTYQIGVLTKGPK